MKKRTAAAILATVAAALAYRPSREVVGALLIDIGIHIAYGPPPPRAPEVERRAVECVMDEIRKGKAKEVGAGPI